MKPLLRFCNELSITEGIYHLHISKIMYFKINGSKKFLLTYWICEAEQFSQNQIKTFPVAMLKLVFSKT